MSHLEFKPIDLENHADVCIQFAEDTEVCSFGSVDGFRENDGQGAQRFIERIGEKLSKDPQSCIHVWKDGVIVGQIHLGQFIDPLIGYIHFFYVAPSWRGTEVAQQMEQHATSYFRQRGFEAARLSVSATNLRAMRFYLRCDWKDLGPREDKPGVHNMEKIFRQRG
jgi:ribosomal protein S18 acetylase RimI-like enzyme